MLAYSGNNGACDVRWIYANFLFEDHDGNLQFAHPTARSFVLNLEAKEEGGSAGADKKCFSQERNDCSMATACFTILKDSAHPVWRKARLIPDEGAGPDGNDARSNVLDAIILSFQSALLPAALAERYLAWNGPDLKLHLMMCSQSQCDPKLFTVECNQMVFLLWLRFSLSLTSRSPTRI